MQKRQLIAFIRMTVLLAGLTFSLPASSAAQEMTPAQQEQEGSMGMHGARGTEKRKSMMAEMQQRHEQMEKMQQEMLQELQQQLTALRAHAKTMDGITDEKQLLTELKKHQQLTDELLGTMVEQRAKMHARMKEHHEQMRSRMEKKQQTKGKDSGCCGNNGGSAAKPQSTEEKELEGHDAHHSKE